jgi:hypothetical protein
MHFVFVFFKIKLFLRQTFLRGCLTYQAEIIPLEPAPGNAGEGI